MSVIEQQVTLGWREGGSLDLGVFDELRELGEAVGGDFLAQLVEEFVDSTDPLFAELGDALEARDTLNVGRITHSIKGSCGLLGGRRLASACDRLETRAAKGRLACGRGDLTELQSDYDELRRLIKQRLAHHTLRPRL